MVFKALAIVLVIVSALAVWQFIRAEGMVDAADKLETCQEIQKLKKEAEDETDDDLADSISGFNGLW